MAVLLEQSVQGFSPSILMREAEDIFFQIEEGQGQLIKNGAIKMIQKEKSVMSYVSLYDTLELSHEVLDFINQAEFAAMINGKPLYTIMQYQQREKTLIQ